jgi:hypothetical protein
MKKLLALTLALVLTLSLAACSGGGNSNSGIVEDRKIPNNSQIDGSTEDSLDDVGSNSVDDAADKELTASVTAANGWERDTNVPYPVYKMGGVSFTILPATPETSLPPGVDPNNAEAVAKYLLETLKENDMFKDIVFADIPKTNINGMDAYGYEYTFFSVVNKTYYICKDNWAYHFTISYPVSEYDAVKDDIQNMLDSYTLK